MSSFMALHPLSMVYIKLVSGVNFSQSKSLALPAVFARKCPNSKSKSNLCLVKGGF